MSTKEQAAVAAIGITQRLEPLLAQLSNIGKSFADISTAVNDTHEQSQLLSALIDALQLPVTEKIVEVLPPNFLDVRAFADSTGKIVGAKGDGKTDDTAMLQLASDTAAKLGMVCYFSKGRYMVDARKSLRPKFGSEWFHHPESLLCVIPNAEQKTNCVLIEAVTDVLIHGINIEGDRVKHDYSNPGTEEWGHGIKIIGTCKRIHIQRFDIRRCHGDGISASGEDITIVFGKSLENRRQGLTIGGMKHGRILWNEFSKTGRLVLPDGSVQAGTAPMAGIDNEPDKNPTDDLLIEGNKCFDNGTAGILIWVRSEVGVAITNVILRNNELTENANQIETKALGTGRIEYKAYGNFLKRQASSGVNIKVGPGTTAVIGGMEGHDEDFNTFSTPDGKRADKTVNGRTAEMQYDIQIIQPKVGEVAAMVQTNWNNLK